MRGKNGPVPNKQKDLARYFFCHRDHREKNFLTSVSSVAKNSGTLACG